MGGRRMVTGSQLEAIAADHFKSLHAAEVPGER